MAIFLLHKLNSCRRNYRKLFKGGIYSRKYSMLDILILTTWTDGKGAKVYSNNKKATNNCCLKVELN